jgi:hypothetical protein
LIAALIKTARSAAEAYTLRAFITQTWVLVMDGFADVDEAEPFAGFAIGPRPGVVTATQWVQLSRQPIAEISSIKTTDSAGVQTTVDPAAYFLDAAGGVIVLKDGQTWPTGLRDVSAVEITFKAGYGDSAASVPHPIRQAILQQVASLFESRQCGDIPHGAKALLDPYRLPEAFGAW